MKNRKKEVLCYVSTIRKVNKSHLKINSCYFLAVEITYIQVLGRQRTWHRIMQLAN